MKKKLEHFKGWDWTELYDGLGIKGRRPRSNSKIAERILEEINTARGGCHKKDETGVAEICRKYMIELVKCNSSYATPAWKGMIKIKHDGVFLDFVGHYLEWMWS